MQNNQFIHLCTIFYFCFSAHIHLREQDILHNGKKVDLYHVGQMVWYKILCRAFILLDNIDAGLHIIFFIVSYNSFE